LQSLGIQLGIGNRIKAFVDKSQKTAYQVENGNRELVTIIETVCADGTTIPPSVIFQGKKRNLEWGRNNPANARYVIDTYMNTQTDSGYSISHSPNGWTDQELGSAWLERNFDRFTKARMTSNGYRLLILDGHNSHCTYKFCKYASDNNIIVICLPPHTTHALQPCDVGVFGPLAKEWKIIVTALNHQMVPVTKGNLLEHYHKARVKAFKPSTLISAFRKTGIWPLDPNALPPSAYAPALNTTTQSAQPIPAPAHPFTISDPTTTVPFPIPSALATVGKTSSIAASGPVDPISDVAERSVRTLYGKQTHTTQRERDDLSNSAKT